MSCDDVKHCISSNMGLSKAKYICSNSKKCKAFVTTLSGNAYFKNDLTTKIISKPGVNLYVKSEHAQSIKIPLSAKCVVPLSEIQTNVTSGCNIAEFDPFDPEIQKYIKKPALPLRCDGLELSRYRNGVLTFTNKGKQGTVWWDSALSSSSSPALSSLLSFINSGSLLLSPSLSFRHHHQRHHHYHQSTSLLFF